MSYSLNFLSCGLNTIVEVMERETALRKQYCIYISIYNMLYGVHTTVWLGRVRARFEPKADQRTEC